MKNLNALVTPEEFEILSATYTETYPVRPLMNTIKAQRAEMLHMRETLALVDKDLAGINTAYTSLQQTVTDAIATIARLRAERDTAFNHHVEADNEVIRLNAALRAMTADRDTLRHLAAMGGAHANAHPNCEVATDPNGDRWLGP